jgi:hypothetical protein
MKFKEILRKAWLPVLTVLAICAVAGLLAVVINGNSTAQAEQITVSSANGTTPSSEDATKDAQATPTATPATAKEEIYPSPESVEDFRYYLYISDEGNANGVDGMPGADAMDFREAGKSAIGMLLKTFGEEFIIENPDVYVTYNNYFGRSGGGYSIAVGVTADKTGGVVLGTSKFYCYMDSVCGEVYSVGKVLHTQDLGNKFDEDVFIALGDEMDIAQLKRTAKSIIDERFADGRAVIDVQVNNLGENIICNGQYSLLPFCDVRMSEGACYKVHILYPSYEVVSVGIYPLGWDACYKGYWDETDSPDYDTSDNWQTAPGIEGAAAKTPAPTPTPAS